MFFIWSNGSCGTNRGDEAGTEQPLLGAKYRTADARGFAERLDSINCSTSRGLYIRELGGPDRGIEVADGTRGR